MPKKNKSKKIKSFAEGNSKTVSGKRFTNRLSNAETERLAWLAEECGEVIHAIGKIMRHGYGRKNPDKENSRSNRMNLCEELGHVHCAIGLMQHFGDVQTSAMMQSSVNKNITVRPNLHHQRF